MDDQQGVKPGETPLARPKASRFIAEASALRDSGDAARALAVAEAGLAIFPDDPGLLKFAAKISEALGDTDRAVRHWTARADLGVERTETMLRLAGVHLEVADVVSAWCALKAAMKAGVQRDALRVQFAQVSLLQRDYKTGLELIDAEIAEKGSSPHLEMLHDKLRKRLRIVQKQRGPAPIRLKSAATTELRAWAQQTGAPTEDLSTDLQRLITRDGDVLLERVQGSRALVIVFGGLGTMFGGAPEDLGFLVQKKKVNALYLSDPQRLFLLNGLSSIGSYPESIAWIKALSETWSARNLYCLGFSAGGYPALRYGVDLGVKRIFTFAAPTRILPGITEIDKRATALAHRVLTRNPDMCIDLRGYIERLGDRAPEIVNYYGETMPEDSTHALNLAGLPTVTLRAISAWDSHEVVGGLRERGEYADILEEFLRDSDA